MTHNDGKDTNNIITPENTEKLYGNKADQKELVAGQEETLEISEPDDVDGLSEENLFSNPE